MNKINVARPVAGDGAAGEADLSRLTETPAFHELLAEIRARRDEIHKGRHVPRDIVAKMKAARIFRAATPSKFGGDAMAPHHFLKMVEKIGEADGSAAWVAAFGSANTYIAALPEETQAEIYAGGPDQVYAGGLYPLQKAERVEGGWKVSGRWKFASGCMGADWIGVGITGGSAEGGAPQVLMAVAPAAEVEIVETWDVMGMLGTGSHDTVVTDKVYADAWTCARGSQGIFADRLYRYPPLAYQAQVHAACNLGLARAALDLAAGMAGGAKLMPGAARLAERGYFRSGLAESEARVRAARSLYYEMAEQAWDELAGREEVTLETNNLLRLSASHAARASAEAIQACFRISGMASIQEGHPMQRILRDCLVVTQHAALNDQTIENAGAVLAGMPAPAGYP
ncbi:acyl-CoA dehydrogenase family protein [Poseidonocella sp. HB161398]|uniref:acyl-CoA dehydrogenase family protein n=1 Tax=Poseidonocella sp. HB161398 TaxID=2320855 RepID=UPI0011087ACE|nr:acyl-CoA dehydrogenase family protein [Poseidonocella sp. HB161398]